MPMYISVSVTFLDPVPTFHGRGDGTDPEWPPSPVRLFQALLAASASRWRGEQFSDYVVPAFQWLQEQLPPLIIAPNCHTGTPVRVAVPNNDLDTVASAWAKGQQPKKQPNELKTMKTVRPTHLLGGDTVHYLWELPEPLTEEVRGFIETLSAAARSVVSLGWGVDLVAGRGRIMTAVEVDQLTGERWRPTADSGTTGLRVPAVGTLEALQQRHLSFLGRLAGDGFTPVPPLAAFAVVSYRRATDVAHRPFAAFDVWKNLADLADLPPGKSRFRPFDPVRWSASVAGMVRHAIDLAARDAEWNAERINTFIHGHTSDGTNRLTGETADSRFAYLPLPSLESRGGPADHVGMIRRVLVVGPPGAEQDVGWVRRSLAGRELFEVGKAGPIALLSPLSDRDPQIRKYTGPAKVWSTVTPVIRPGHDDGNVRKAERLLRTAFVQAGYPQELIDKIPPSDLEWRAVGFRPGADLASRYRVPEGLGRFPRYHVRVRFPVAVRGPVVVGAGRYRGLGLFAAEAE